MSDSPATPLFAKRAKPRAARERPSAAAGAGADDGPEDEPSPLTLAAKLKKTRLKPKARLSFGGDDEEGGEPAFELRKSALSRRLKAGASPATPLSGAARAEDTGVGSAPPSYTKAFLAELKASTPSTPPPARRGHVPDMDLDMSFDEMAAVTLTGDDAAALEAAAGASAIPAESAIQAAKQKRGRLRATGAGAAEDEYISLSVARRGEDDGPHPESRLVREDDELGEGDDDMAEYTGAQDRIALGKKARKEEQRKQKAGIIEMLEDAEEEDEETMEWEMAQVRRAAASDRDLFADQTQEKPVYRPAPVPAVMAIPTVAASIAKFDQALLALTNSHATSTTTLTTLEQERQTLDDQERELRIMVEKAEEKRSWFAAFREWIESIASFLDEKVPLLEKAEKEHVSLSTERYQMITKRRREDDEDDLALFFGSPQISVVTNGADSEEAAPQPTPAVVRGQRRFERSTRRTLRRGKAAATNGAHVDEEGNSTDAELPPTEATDFEEAMAALAGKVEAILADVQARDFRDPRLGLAKWFGEWRSRFPDNYVGAWGGLGLVAAWEFWARLEITGWDPLADGRLPDSFEWYQALHDYSRPRLPGDTEGEEPELGPDGDLARAMLSTAIVGRLCKLIEGGAFDPYCASHVRRLIDLVEFVEASLQNEHAKFELLLKSAALPFRNAVDMTAEQVRECSQGGMARTFDPLAPPARRRFLVRRLKLLRNVLRWRKYSGEKFGIGEIATRLVLECMIPVAESGWDVGGKELMQRVFELLPAELVPNELRIRM